MRVLVACEFSGVVRNAFLARGHDAYSCDVYPSVSNGPHLQEDVLGVLGDGWDLMVAHPPCTYLAVSGNRWMRDVERQMKRLEAIQFFKALLNAPIPKVCVENPVSTASTHVRKPDQVVQPYWFGDRVRKTTCLWLRGLPPLVPTDAVEPVVKRHPCGASYHPERVKANWLPEIRRQRERSRTYPGIAKAMAEQWGRT